MKLRINTTIEFRSPVKVWTHLKDRLFIWSDKQEKHIYGFCAWFKYERLNNSVRVHLFKRIFPFHFFKPIIISYR